MTASYQIKQLLYHYVLHIFIHHELSNIRAGISMSYHFMEPEQCSPCSY